MKPFCTRCAIELAPDADRCPQCLRTSTVVDRSRPTRERGARPPILELDGIPSHPSHAGVRVALLALAWLIAGLATWMLPEQAWLEERRLWVAACAGLGASWLLPLRAAFVSPEAELSSREAWRHYASRTAGVIGGALLFTLVIAGASQLVDSAVAAIFIALALFLMLILAGPPLLAALLGRRPAAEAFRLAARNAGIALLIVCGIGVIVVLKSSTREPQTTVRLPPSNIKELLDPLDIQSVKVTSTRTMDAQGLYTTHLAADGSAFQRTIGALIVSSISAADVMKTDDRAAGIVKLWLPERFERSDGDAARTDIDAHNRALESMNARTPAGRPIRLELGFGQPP